MRPGPFGFTETAMTARYAIYYAPAANSRWWQFGSRWLGRDAVSGEPLPQFEVPGMQAEAMREATAEPRRYGFHATLKPPFALPEGADPHDLYQLVKALAKQQQPFPLGLPRLRTLGGFLALAPDPEPAELAVLAADCVGQLDMFRAAPAAGELAHRRAVGLSPRQDELLSRWGYPYVMEEWRFHMTLTGRLPADRRRVLVPWLEMRLRELQHEPLVVDALCVFEQAAPEAAFRLTQRFAFGAGRGRLVYVVGASGSGKDSLINHARAGLAGRPVAFARRHITRDAAAGGEDHYSLSRDEFEVRSSRGAFALQWRSNGHCYGIGTEIDHWLAQGMTVVVNGSREYLDRAREIYPDLTVVWISASAETLRVRLSARGREDAEAVEQRLRRAAQYAPPPEAILIANDGALGAAGDTLVGVLSEMSAGAPARPRRAATGTSA